MYPFHRQARQVGDLSFSNPYISRRVQLNIWTMGFLISPFLSPFAFGFLVARAEFVSPFLDALFLTVVNILVGDGHTELAPCTADWCFSLLSALDVRRKLGYFTMTHILTRVGCTIEA